MAEQPKSVRDQIVTMFMKVAAKTISREEGTLFLNDIVKRSGNKSEVVKVILELCQKPPKDVHVKTIFHTVALAKNPAFSKLLEVGLDHKSEDICITSAEGLVKLGNDEAKNSLVHHLVSDAYHVRKVSADVLVKGWGREGIRLVLAHGLSHPEVYYRYTSALALAKSGKMGIAALLELFTSNNMNAIQSAADALSENAEPLGKADVPRLVHALELAVNCKHTTAVTALLKLLGALKDRAGGFEEHIAVLLDYNYEPIRIAAGNALASISTVRAKELLSPPGEAGIKETPLSTGADGSEDYWTK